MKKLLLLMYIFLILNIINVEWINVPKGGGNGWDQLIKIICEDRILFLNPDNIDDFDLGVPLGKVEFHQIEKGFYGKMYKFKKVN